MNLGFNSLPSDIILYETLIKLDPLELLSYCQVDKQARRYCNNPTFLQKYNNILSNDDYQFLMLEEAYNNNDKSFLTLFYKSYYFKKVVDRRTTRRSFLYFAERENRHAVDVISGFMHPGGGLHNPSFPNANIIIPSVTGFKKFLLSFSKSEKAGTLKYDVRDWNYPFGINFSQAYGDTEYSGDLIVNNLSFPQIKRLSAVLIDAGVKKAYDSDKPMDPFSSISDAVVRSKNQKLFSDLSETGLISKNIFNSIVTYGDLECFQTWKLMTRWVDQSVKELFDQKMVLFNGKTMIPHNRDVYLYCLDNYITEKDKINYLEFGFWAFDPDEWIHVVNDLDLDKDVKYNLYTNAFGQAHGHGYTFWEETIWNKRNKMRSV